MKVFQLFLPIFHDISPLIPTEARFAKQHQHSVAAKLPLSSHYHQHIVTSVRQVGWLPEFGLANCCR